MTCWSSAGSIMAYLGHTVVYRPCGLNHELTIYGSVVVAGQFTDMLVAASSLMTCSGSQYFTVFAD